MPRMWATRPEEVQRAQALEDQGKRPRQELDEIEGLSSPTACRLCDTEATLTAEHSPSKKVGT